jgi:hypothetical protein
MSKHLDRLLAQMEESRYRFGRGESARVITLLRALDRQTFRDAKSIIRFHESLMFLRAFPQSSAVIHKTESILTNFWRKVAVLRDAGADMDVFDGFEDSGVAGTEMRDTLSFEVARWLVRRMGGQVEIDWDQWDESRAKTSILPRFLPLLEDDALVEADTPWREWIESAQRTKSRSPLSLIERFEGLPLSAHGKAELYDSLRVPLRWKLDNSSISRTRNRRPLRSAFYHDGPLIARSEVNLANELSRPPVQFTNLSRREGERVMESIREVMLVRYRELYGTTLGDPKSVVRAQLGRGVVIYLWGLPPERRLPLRAYVAGFTWKNGVPVNYIEAIAMFEWMEVGFNTFYTFRGGEAGWIYAQVLRCLCNHMGTTCVSVYPYQLGDDNEEAIESGAFWFYRKLGFRPGRRDLQRVVEREERKIGADRDYRTPARTLRRLAKGHVFYELPGSQVGAWDSFSTRNVGLRVNRFMAQRFGGNRSRFCEAARKSLAKTLGISLSSWDPEETLAFENFAMVLSLARDVQSWTRTEKAALVQIIRAKIHADEMQHLHLLQNHDRLRSLFLELGS